MKSDLLEVSFGVNPALTFQLLDAWHSLEIVIHKQ